MWHRRPRRCLLVLFPSPAPPPASFATFASAPDPPEPPHRILGAAPPSPSGSYPHCAQHPARVHNSACRRGHVTGTISTAIAATGSNMLTKSGMGTLVLSGNNTYTGNVNIVQGNLTVANSGALGTGTKNINLSNGSAGNGFLNIDGTNGNVSLPSSFTYYTSGGQINNLAGTNTLAGQINMTSGGGSTFIQSTAGTLNITANITATTNNRTLWLQGAGNGTISGNITNTGGNAFNLIKQSAGTWTLSGTNGYTLGTSISGGVLQFSASNNLGDATSSSNTLTMSGGTLQMTGSGTVDLGSNRTFTASNNPTVQVDGTGILTLSGSLTGGFTKAGAGTLILNGSYTTAQAPTVAINGGTLKIGTAGAWGTAQNAAFNMQSTGATLDVNGFSNASTFATTNDNAGNAIINSSGTLATLSYGSSNTNAALGATVSGNIKLVYVGNSGGGALTLGGNNTFTGGVTLSGTNGGGSLVLNGDNAAGSGTITLTGSGANGTDGHHIYSTTGSRTLANALVLGGTKLTFGPTSGTAYKLTFTNTVNLGGGSPILNTITDTEFQGVVSNGGISKAGSGTLSLSITRNRRHANRCNADGG